MSDIDQAPPLAPAKAKWHDTKWKLAAAAAAVGIVVGFGMGAGDAQDSQAEHKRIVAAAKKERAEILGGAGREKDTLESDLEALRSEHSEIEPQVAKLRNDLGSLKKQKAKRTFSGEGIYMVGADIAPGTYRAAASVGCYYAVLRDLQGNLGSIIANGNVDGPVVIEVPSNAKGVEVSNCSSFTRVS